MKPLLISLIVLIIIFVFVGIPLIVLFYLGILPISNLGQPSTTVPPTTTPIPKNSLITFYSTTGNAKAYNISGNIGDRYYVPFHATSSCIPTQVTDRLTNSLLSQGATAFIPASLTVTGSPVNINYIGDGNGQTTCNGSFGIIPASGYSNISGFFGSSDYTWIREWGVKYAGGAIIQIQ